MMMSQPARRDRISQILVGVSWTASPSSALAGIAHAEDEITLFGVLYLSGFVLAGVVAAVIILWLQRRARNPSTGLPRPIKRRRAKGPLKNI